MDIGLREWLVIGGVLVIVLIILDGWRRIRGNRNRLRMDIDRSIADLPEEPERTFNPELPNGGARVVNKSPLFTAAYEVPESPHTEMHEYDPLLSPAPRSAATDTLYPDDEPDEAPRVTPPSSVSVNAAAGRDDAARSFDDNDGFDELIGPARVAVIADTADIHHTPAAKSSDAYDSVPVTDAPELFGYPESEADPSIALAVSEQQAAEEEPFTAPSIVSHEPAPEALRDEVASDADAVAETEVEAEAEAEMRDAEHSAVTVVEEELSWHEFQAHEAEREQQSASFLDDTDPMPALGDLKLDDEAPAVAQVTTAQHVVVEDSPEQVSAEAAEEEDVSKGLYPEIEQIAHEDEPLGHDTQDAPVSGEVTPAAQLVVATEAGDEIDLDKPIPIAFDFSDSVSEERDVEESIAEAGRVADKTADQLPLSAPAPHAVREPEIEMPPVMQSGSAKKEIVREAAKSPVTHDLFADRTALEKTPEPDKVLIITVLADKGREIRGERLLPLVKACGMQFGDMDIFHRFEDGLSQGAVQFSMADAVNPGVFDIEHIEKTVTRGLTFFMSMEEPRDIMNAFECMLATAETVAKHMGAELLDENRSVLRPQTKEHYRQRIRDYEMHNRARRPR